MIPFGSHPALLLEFNDWSSDLVKGIRTECEWLVCRKWFLLFELLFLLPFASMILVDSIRIEQVSKMISNFRLIPVDFETITPSEVYTCFVDKSTSQ